jgi:hypothetical protein
MNDVKLLEQMLAYKATYVEKKLTKRQIRKIMPQLIDLLVPSIESVIFSEENLDDFFDMSEYANDTSKMQSFRLQIEQISELLGKLLGCWMNQNNIDAIGNLSLLETFYESYNLPSLLLDKSIVLAHFYSVHMKNVDPLEFLIFFGDVFADPKTIKKQVYFHALQVRKLYLMILSCNNDNLDKATADDDQRKQINTFEILKNLPYSNGNYLEKSYHVYRNYFDEGESPFSKLELTESDLDYLKYLQKDMRVSGLQPRKELMRWILFADDYDESNSYETEITDLFYFLPDFEIQANPMDIERLRSKFESK